MGLPQEIFLFVSHLLPLVNVDLLIQDAKGRTLLTWRDDVFCGSGWHIPGGILRFKERLETRIAKVAAIEVGTTVDFNPVPLAVNQCIDPDPIRRDRGHFISFLYRCRIPDDYVIDNRNRKPTDPGFAAWHENCPENLIAVHRIYRKFI